MNKAYNKCLFTRLPGKYALVHPAVGWTVGNSLGSRANITYLPGNDKLIEIQLYMSTLCQPGIRQLPNQKIEKMLFNVREGSD